MKNFSKKTKYQVQAKFPGFITNKISKKHRRRARILARLLKYIFRETRYS